MQLKADFRNPQAVSSEEVSGKDRAANLGSGSKPRGDPGIPCAVCTEFQLEKTSEVIKSDC